MTVFDYVVLLIVGLSIILSMMRGLIKEILGLVGWVAAFLVAKLYVLQVVPLLPDTIPTEALRFLAGFLILFLSTLLICSLLSIAITHIFKRAGISWVGRSLGALFGLARGLIIVLIMVFIAGLTKFPQDSRWRNAMLSAPLEALVSQCLVWLPHDITKHVKYD